MTLYLRLLAGLTSFRSNLARLHFSASGPAGTRASRFMSGSGQLDDAEQDGGRRGHVADEEDEAEDGTQLVDQRVVLGVAQAERLRPARRAMAEVHAEQRDRDQVDDEDRDVLEAPDEHRVGVVALERIPHVEVIG